jgi:hypothetical protein
MYNKLKQFSSDRESKQTSSTFLERFTFWKKEQHRKKCLEQLRIWNKRLGRLIYNAQKEPLTNSAVAVQSQAVAFKRSVIRHCRVPSSQPRRLSQQLYKALSRCWGCCPIRHEARFCLKLQKEERTDVEGEADFDFLVSFQAKRNNQWTWQEGHILIRSDRRVTGSKYVSLEAYCCIAWPLWTTV